jgi:nitrate/nitrite transporter NarK
MRFLSTNWLLEPPGLGSEQYAHVPTSSSRDLGPGDMLGLILSESYAIAVRGTCYGISAAIGKSGAAVGTQAFTPIQLYLGKRWTSIIAAICGVVGIAATYFFVKDLTSTDLGERDEKFRAYLVANRMERWVRMI